MKTNACRSGFLLLMVLVAIVLVGVALTTTARRVLRIQQVALESQDSLQRRWGSLSCERVLLPSAAGLFLDRDGQTRARRGQAIVQPPQIADRIRLGELTFDLIIADEDAKANLNTIRAVGGDRACEQAIRALTPPGDMLAIRLTAAPQWQSWGEVFDLKKIQQTYGDDRQLATLTGRMTLFGSGKLNVFRATDDSVLAVVRPVVQDGLARRLTTRLRDGTVRESSIVLLQTVSNAANREKLSELVADGSSSFSLWTEVSSSRWRTQTLAVRTPNEFGAIRTLHFSLE